VAQLLRAFGELTYSIYLLHGPLLFLVFRFALVFDHLMQFSVFQYWGVIALMVPLLLCISICVHLHFEKYFMQKTTDWSAQAKMVFKFRIP